MNVFFVCLALFASLQTANAQALVTVAGGGPSNLSALQTGLPSPAGLTVDSSGNIYFSILNQIWLLDSAGKIRVFAGNGTSSPPGSNGYGDGLQATQATLSGTGTLLFDSSGNLLVLDGGHHSVRKISPSGIVSTVAGLYSPATYADPNDGGAFINGYFSQMAIDSSNNIYLSDSSNRRVWQVSSAGVISTFAGGGNSGRGDGGPATSANLMYRWE